MRISLWKNGSNADLAATGKCRLAVGMVVGYTITTTLGNIARAFHLSGGFTYVGGL